MAGLHELALLPCGTYFFQCLMQEPLDRHGSSSPLITQFKEESGQTGVLAKSSSSTLVLPRLIYELLALVSC